MKVTHFEATQVHGYLPITIGFHPSLTFLTGLNGSGKTTALRLLMGLLGPDLPELCSVLFQRVAVTIVHQGLEIVITAARTADGLKLSTTQVDADLDISAAELELLLEGQHREEPRRPGVLEKLSASPVYQSVAKISTPMFLGLDRRFTLPTDAWPDPLLARRWELEVRREYEFRRRRMVEPGIRTSPEASLSDVNYLVSATLNVIRASQERLDDQLRTQILLNSFRYTPPEFKDYGKGPTRAELDQYRKRVAAVKRAATGLRIPVGEVESALNSFFEKMDKVVSALEESAKSGERKSSKKGRKNQPSVEQTGPSPLVLEWMLNRTQTDRILHQIEQLESYARDRSRLHEPVDRFLALANTFLEQTHKALTVAPDNTLGIEINADGKQRPIATLSSGERQLVIMLAHLSLNPRLSGSGVFIVDEPELSLHVGWQERFVDAIREANPNVQLIMATHSPSIILDKIENCCSLS